MKLEIKGADALLTKLKKGAEYSDVKKVVKVNTAEMHKQAKRNAVFKGHYRGNKFIKPTGFLKRSIEMEVTDQVGKVTPTAHYAYWVELGTRYMAAQPFIAPAYHIQKKVFINDLKRIME